jgi:protein subunit release factor A
MAESSPAPEFDLHVLRELEKLFGPDNLEVLVWRSDEAYVGQKTTHSAVFVRHVPSGKEAMCNDYSSQIRNKAACLLTLLLDTPRLS